MLKRHTRYSGGVRESDEYIQWFWQVLGEFTHEDRRRFVKFAWGQSRLPTTDADWRSRGLRFLIKPVMERGGHGGGGGEGGAAAAAEARRKSQDGRLLHADTCFFNVELPRYSSLEVMRRQLTLCISIASGLDGD